MKMATALEEGKLLVSGQDAEFVTVVTVDPVPPPKPEPFVTILSIGDGDPWPPASEEVLVYRLPGERLGFGLKFDGGSNAAEKVTKLMIQSCAPDSPASRTIVSWGHFAPGDEILHIDDVPVTEMTRMECVRALKESNVRLRLRVRKGGRKEGSVRGPAKQTKTAAAATPPPVPPRKYPRRGCSKNTAGNGVCSMPIVCPPEGFDDAEPGAAIAMVRMRERLGVPEPQVYTDLIGQEAASLGNLESESDDTGSSMSTIVDKHFSTPTTSNSSFSDARSITSAEMEPPSPDVVCKNRKLDLDKVLEPFLQLEREFSSCATIEDNDLFQKLVAAATLKDGCGTAEVSVLEPPDSFQDGRQQCYQVEEDLNNNSVKRESLKTVVRLEGAEEPPKPLPRKEIPCKVSPTKYGKKRPPPPPPPLANDRLSRCPTPDRELEHHESSDSDLSVDRLPRLIDFVPKDRCDLVIPSAVHPDPMDMLLERQRIMSIVSQNTGGPNMLLEFTPMERAGDEAEELDDRTEQPVTAERGLELRELEKEPLE